MFKWAKMADDFYKTNFIFFQLTKNKLKPPI